MNGRFTAAEPAPRPPSIAYRAARPLCRDADAGKGMTLSATDFATLAGLPISGAVMDEPGFREHTRCLQMRRPTLTLPARARTAGMPISFKRPITVTIVTANKNDNTGASTTTPGIVDHMAQIGRLSMASLLALRPIRVRNNSQRSVPAPFARGRTIQASQIVSR